MTAEAIKKLEKELSEAKGLGHKEKFVSMHVFEALKLFCKNVDFAEAVVNSEGNIAACLTSIMKNTGSTVSDIEVYQKAASFYFPTSKVKFEMTIELNGEVSTVTGSPVVVQGNKESNIIPLTSKKKINISLDDLL